MVDEVKVHDEREVFEAACRHIPRRESDQESTDRWIVTFYRISDGHQLGQRWLTRMPTEDELGMVLEEWIYEKAGSQPAAKVYCGTGCGNELVPEANMDTEYQFDNALHIQFNGGYGMFIDPMFDKPPSTFICHECAHALCDALPWICELLNPHSSHSHKMTYVEAHPDHYGWDYDSRKERELESDH